MKYKVLVNASTLVMGGGVQVGVSFLEYLFDNIPEDFQFIFAISESIHKNLPNRLKNKPNLYLINKSPAAIISGNSSRKELIELEKDFKPDLIYSIGFPSYLRFKNTEVGRYTNPWEIFKAKEARKLLTKTHRIILWLKTQYRLYWARGIDYYETQTETAKSAIGSTLNVPQDSIKVISNSINQIFMDQSDDSDTALDTTHYIFCLAAPYPHKNLEMIPRVAKQLKNYEGSYKFLLTLPNKSEIWKNIRDESKRLSVEGMIKNIGVLKIAECLDWYKKSNMVFLPTLLEVFSATYLEAMAMKKPIITTDLDFAREVCGEAAIYFKPHSSLSAAQEINRLFSDKD